MSNPLKQHHDHPYLNRDIEIFLSGGKPDPDDIIHISLHSLMARIEPSGNIVGECSSKIKEKID